MNTQPIIIQDNPQPFIVRVKLLTNQVHDFQVNKQMKVSQFKALISPKFNVPIDRMRIVFAGKQLLDDKPLSEYVSQSGMTVHLIARTAPPPESQPVQTTSNPQSTSNSASQSSQNPFNINPNSSQGTGQQVPPNSLGDIMGMVNSLFGGNVQQSGNPPQITMAFGNLGGGMNNNSNPLQGLLSGLGGLGGLSGLGMRVQSANNSNNLNQPNQPQPQPPVQPSTQPQQLTSQRQPQSQSQPQPQVSQNSQNNRIQYSQISQLNQALNNLIVPLDSVTTEHETFTPQGVIRYLRRLHHQSSRSLLQLNRLLYLAENNHNNTENLQNFVPVFQAMSSANNVAVNSLLQLRNQRTHNNHTHNNNNNSQSLPPNQSVPQVSVVSMNVTISDETGSMSPINFQAQRSPQQPIPPQQQPIPQQPQQRPQQPAQQSQPQMQMPINPMQMLGGLDLGGILGGLSSVGGINGLFGLTLRQMISQGQQTGTFLQLFGGMTGQNLMQMFTTKDFKFLKDKHPQIRELLNKKITETSQQQVINKITKQVTKVIVPSQPHSKIPNLQQCRQSCIKNIKKYVKQLVKLSLSTNQPQYDVKVVEIVKKTFCENVKIIVQNTTNNIESVPFEIIKYQSISIMEPVLPVIAGMFYGLIQRDLFRIYNQFKVQQQRRKQMSVEETKSEQQLVDLIKQVGPQDAQILAKKEHTSKYFEEQ